MPRIKYGKPDAGNPEITPEEMGQARPAGEVLPQFFAGDGSLKQRSRGPQKTEPESPYRATERGRQSRL